MYEENLTPLPPGDLSVVFAETLAEMKRDAAIRPVQISPETAVHSSNRANLPRFGAICRRLLLPGSRIIGGEHLTELSHRAAAGQSCLLCLIHRSNSDVPTLYTLLADQADEDVFHKIIWISGRKLTEDSDVTRMLLACLNHVVITPKSWLSADHTAEELHDAHMLNAASQRAVMNLRHDGWIFGLFPSGTRIRPGDESTAQAISETDTYIKSFENMVLGHIQGCTLPVSQDWQLMHEVPRLDRMIYTFGRVMPTADWREQAARRYPKISQRAASARAIMEDIAALAPAKE